MDEEQPQSSPRRDPPGGLGSARQLRPWYLVATMALTWLVGVLGATAACGHVSYLRGSQEALDRADTVLTEAQDAMERLPAVVEKARLTAYAQHHRLAFPLSLAQTLLYVVLALISGAAIAGRRGARKLAIQVVLANALLAMLSFAALQPIRQAVAEAVAADAVEHGQALASLGTTSSAEYREAYVWAERIGLGLLVVGVYGSALLALTRSRTKEFFDAVAAALAKIEQGDANE